MQLLLNSNEYSLVKVFLRRDIPLEHPKLKKYIIDFDKLDSYKEELSCDDVFCCLGTTIKHAGSSAEIKTKEGAQVAFKKVDCNIPLQFAKLTKEKGAQQYLVVSSLGAKLSTSNFYLRTKGQVEEGLKNIEFNRLVILRPSMLLGNRKPFRFWETMGQFIMLLFIPLMLGKARKYRAIQAKTVAFSMLKMASFDTLGITILESDKIN